VALPQGGSLIPLPSVAVPSSVNSLNNSGNIQVYPNPAGDYFNVVSSERLARISVMDVTGRILTDVNNNTQGKIDISNLSQGVYIVKLETENGVVSTHKINKK